MQLGDLIKKRRLKLGMTQKQLSDNICTQALISRIENNDVLPNNEILNKIEERLDLNMNELNIVFNVHSHQSKIDNLIDQIRDFLTRREYKSIELLLEYNASIIEASKEINDTAFFKWMEASVANQLHGESNEALAILSGISLNKLNNQLSIEITNALGLIYYQAADYETAISYYREAMQKANEAVDFTVRAKLLFNYALALEENGQFKETLSILLSGIEILLKNDSLHLLGDFYYMKGFIFHKMNNLTEAKDNLEIAKSIFKIQNNTRFYDLTQMALSDIKNKELVEG